MASMRWPYPSPAGPPAGEPGGSGATAPGAAPGRTPTAPAPVTGAQAKSSAQRLLGTKDVLTVKRTAGAVVYADRKAWRRGLTASGKKPALVVTCPSGCEVDSSARLELSRGVKAKGSAVRRLARQSGVARGDQAFAVRLRPGRTDLARLRKARTARAAFELTISGPGTTGKTTLRAAVRR